MKRCKNCGKEISVSKKSEKSFCTYCRTEYKKGEDEKMPDYYRIVIIGKRPSEHFMTVKLRKYWEEKGHEVIMMDNFDMLRFIHDHDLVECTKNKKPISLRPIEYYHNPDIIYVEQMYSRFVSDCEKAIVIFMLREPTHFPDILDADITLFCYPFREEFLDYYYPYEFSKLKIKETILKGVDLDEFKPEVKEEEIVAIGSIVPIDWFINANGPSVEPVMKEQMYFFHEMKMRYGMDIKVVDPPVEHEDYRKLMPRAKGLIIDGGYFGWMTRRIFESAACRTIPIIRVFNNTQKEYYKNIGLFDEENCFLFCNERESEFIPNTKILFDVINFFKERQYKLIDIADKAYIWVKNHTYEKRAEEIISIIKKNYKYKNGRFILND